MYIYDNLAQFFLEWEVFQTNVLENIRRHFKFKNISSEIVPFMR